MPPTPYWFAASGICGVCSRNTAIGHGDIGNIKVTGAVCPTVNVIVSENTARAGISRRWKRSMRCAVVDNKIGNRHFQCAALPVIPQKPPAKILTVDLRVRHANGVEGPSIPELHIRSPPPEMLPPIEISVTLQSCISTPLFFSLPSRPPIAISYSACLWVFRLPVRDKVHVGYIHICDGRFSAGVGAQISAQAAAGMEHIVELPSYSALRYRLAL
jgi:hypothetical protein